MLLKTMIGSISQSDSGDLPKGSGTQSDPYNWYRILDPNNPNGCHTELINQNADEGWIKVKLEGGVTYSIGQGYYDEDGNQFDGYLYVYDSNFNTLMEADATSVSEIDGFSQLDASNYFTPDETGYYYIKASSFNNNYPDRKTTVHCHPAPINEGGGSPGGGNLIEADENCYVIEIQINDTSSPISISDEGSNYGWPPTIDWGDGTLTEGDWNQSFIHFYNETGTYRIIWKNGYIEGENVFANSTENPITDVKQLSKNRSNYDSLFSYCTINRPILYFHIPPNITSIQYMFYDCSGEFGICIDTDFGGCNITNAAYFAYHSSIFQAQLNCFSSAQYTDWSYAFYDCQFLCDVWFSGLTSDSNASFGYQGGNFEGMFAHSNRLNINQTNFDRAFSYWENRNLSDYGVEYSVSEMFLNCNQLSVNVKAHAFWNQSVFVNHDKCFYNCSSIQNYNEIPDDWK
jgi:hypothetical protein